MSSKIPDQPNPNDVIQPAGAPRQQQAAPQAEPAQQVPVQPIPPQQRPMPQGGSGGKIIKVIITIVVAAGLVGGGWLVGSDRVSLVQDDLPQISVDNSSTVPDAGLQELYNEIVENYDGNVTDEEFLEGLKEGLANATGDPFTEYLTVQETKEFNEGLNGTFEGIGAELGKEGNFVIIVAPLKGTPADVAGVQPGDVILEIDGEDATGISISEAVSKIRGEKGTQVVLTLVRDGTRVETPITRGTINIDSVEWEVRDGIGIISISRFGDDTTQLTRQAATELKAQNVSGIVLDVRGNPGGLLDSSVDVSGVWLPQGSTVLEEKRGGQVLQTFRTSSSPILEGIPTVVLVNQGSASASEIVAGALRDNNAATVIGEQSFGKGSVQRLIPLDGGGSLKVTIASWFTPAGKNINEEGIAPDTVIELTAEDREAERDPQLDAALSSLNN